MTFLINMEIPNLVNFNLLLIFQSEEVNSENINDSPLHIYNEFFLFANP